jgi:hypothetical protein
MAKNLRVFKVKGCPDLDKKTLELMTKYLRYAINELGLKDAQIKIRLLGKAPNEPITTGAYNPSDKSISAICGGRHFVDYMRTISHELTHMKQDEDGRINGNEQEIGGEIEDEANVRAGRITKHFIKNILTPEDKKYLGLGNYGS